MARESRSTGARNQRRSNRHASRSYQLRSLTFDQPTRAPSVVEVGMVDDRGAGDAELLLTPWHGRRPQPHTSISARQAAIRAIGRGQPPVYRVLQAVDGRWYVLGYAWLSIDANDRRSAVEATRVAIAHLLGVEPDAFDVEAGWFRELGRRGGEKHRGPSQQRLTGNQTGSASMPADRRG